MNERVGTVIVGAGFAGIAAALALKAAGDDDFVILERAEAVGGTWRDNTYPGVACDVPAHLYGLSSHPWPGWSRTFAPGAEIRAYLEHVVAQEGLERHLRLSTAMVSASVARSSGLDAHAHDVEWEVRAVSTRFARSTNEGSGRPTNEGSGGSTNGGSGGSTNGGSGGPAHEGSGRSTNEGSGGPTHEGSGGPTHEGGFLARNLILAAGRLTEPLIPAIPGLDEFPGPVFHSARWDASIRVQNARIAVVGTGASAIQLAPELARQGAHVTLFQRTPAWIVPRRDRAYARAEREAWQRDPGSLARLREELYVEGEARFASRSGDPVAASEARESALTHLARQVRDPVLRDALTPDYAFGCKRVLLSDDFYPAIASGLVDLVPSALAGASDNQLVAADGSRHEVDVVVLATGFEAARQPYARLVTGEHGRTLDEHWSEGMTSVGSTLVSGFPNLYVLNGPNASLGHNSAVLIMEEQAAFAASLISRGTPIRVDAEAEAAYTAEIAERAAGTPWVEGGCRNWYTDPRSGRLTLLWPGTVSDFRSRLAAVRGSMLAPVLTP